MLKCDCGSRIYVGNKCRECYMANPPMTTDQRIAELEAENKRLRSTLAWVEKRAKLHGRHSNTGMAIAQYIQDRRTETGDE